MWVGAILGVVGAGAIAAALRGGLRGWRLAASVAAVAAVALLTAGQFAPGAVCAAATVGALIASVRPGDA
jgi:anti-sigma-K factor RskA